jgi:hypothetical protein
MLASVIGGFSARTSFPGSNKLAVCAVSAQPTAN